MKKILVLENSYLSTVTMRLALMKALVTEGFEVYILADGKEEFAGRLRQINAKFVDIGSSNINPIEVIKYLNRLHTAIKEINPDICLTFTPRQNIYGNIICKMLKIPVLSNITGTGVPFHIKGLIYWIGRRFYEQVLKNPKVVFFQNKDDLTDLVTKKYVKKDKAVLIPGSGIETNYFLPHKKNNDNKFIFLFIGRLVRIKGIEEYIVAAENIINDTKDCEFWIVGPLWKLNTGKLTFTEADVEKWEGKGIIYKGEATDVRPFLRACDCFVLPSYREGLSNSILEAASMEKPVITTDVTGCRDVVVDGLTGLLCEPKNAVSLEKAMRKMLALNIVTRLEMGKQGRIKVKNEFEKSIVINKYLEQINKFA